MKISCSRSKNLLSLFLSARFLFSSSFRINQRFSRMESLQLNNHVRKSSTLQIGLTGSIGMGKTTISNQFIKLGFPLFDADREVHKLYSVNGAAVPRIQEFYPDVIVDGAVDRNRLSEKIMKDGSVLTVLERIVHPLVVESRSRFYEQACSENRFMVIYDIPLLFENINKYQVDYKIVVTASPEIQKERVLNRPGMTEEKFQTILSKQIPDEIKRQKADFLINTDYKGYSEAKSQLAKVIETIIEKNPTQWEAWKNSKKIPENLEEDYSSATPSVFPTPTPPLSQHIDLVLFDLDDTLVPVAIQLTQATLAMQTYMQEHMPRTQSMMDKLLRNTMKTIMQNNPLISHDLTEVRLRALYELSSPYPEEQPYIHTAMEIFFNSRCQLTGNFYEDIFECLDYFHNQNIKIGILTNGSADLTRCEELNKYLFIKMTAADVGISKPSPVGFLACSQVSHIPPSRVLYIGDSYNIDTLGANNAGMISALLLRKDYTLREVNEENVYSKEELAQQWRESYNNAHIMLSSLRIPDLESGFSEYFGTGSSSDNNKNI